MNDIDLYAHSQIDNLSGIAESNGIYCPRLRGYRLMVNEQAAPDRFWEEMKKERDAALEELRRITST